MFYHPDRRDRVFANYSYSIGVINYDSRKPEGFDEHKEMTPLKENPKDLTEEDYLHILLDSTENFSKKRMDYLIKVSPIVKADRMKRLYGENK